jgi:hypothetical protein
MIVDLAHKGLGGQLLGGIPSIEGVAIVPGEKGEGGIVPGGRPP